MSGYEERYYQRDALDAIMRYFEQNTGNPLIAMPTGTGKGVVIAKFLQTIYQWWPHTRVMILTHVKELIKQNVEKTLDVWPTAPIGIYSAGLNQRSIMNPIIFGGVASVINCIELFGWRDLLIIDEAHLVSPDVATRYVKIIAELKKINPKLKVIGLTATWYRLGQGLLTDAGGIFTDIAYNICDTAGFTRLITEGYLCPPIPKTTATKLDVSHVGMSKGEFNLSQLQNEVDTADINASALREMCQHGQDRQSWLLFCSGIEHSEHVAEMLSSFGVPTAAVHSKTKDRDEIIRAYTNGELRAITNNNVLTTGFDFAPIDFIGMLRPTMSPGLWVQMIGRGTRPSLATNKKNCLVLDFARNTQRLGPIDDPLIPRPPGMAGGGEAPVKLCDACGCFNHTRAKFCISCGEEFTFEQKIVRQADTREILSTGMPQVERYEVERLMYARHVGRKSGVVNIKVAYTCGLAMFTEFVSFDHKGFALHRAHEWWKQRSPEPPPLSTDLALASLHTLRTPRAIHVWVNRPNPEILKHEY